MGNYENNPKKPYEVRCPNKIRKKIGMAEKSANIDGGIIKRNFSFLASIFTQKFALYRSK